MSSIFLERLVSRAIGKEPQVMVKPALTVDMIPQVFQPPEEGFQQYSLPSIEAPAKKGQDNVPNPSLPQQVNSTPSAAAASAESSTKQSVETSSLASSESNLPSDINEPPESNVEENLPQATSPERNLAESPREENAATSISEKTILQPSLQPSARISDEAYLAKEKAKNPTSASAERVTLTSNNPAQLPTAANNVLPIEKENLDLADSAHRKTNLKVPFQSEQPAESSPKISVSIKQISSISGQNVPIQNEGLPQTAHSQTKANVSEINEIDETSSMLKPALEEETSTKIQPTKSLDNGLNLESPKPYPSGPTLASRARLQRDAETIVTIHIGRIEVHAVREQEPAANPPRGPVLSLNDYLKQRSEEK